MTEEEKLRRQHFRAELETRTVKFAAHSCLSDKVGGVPLYSSDGALSEMMERCKDGKDRRKETAALSKWVMCLFALAMFHWNMAWGGNLVVCPDCGNDVSRRAMFCPKHGATDPVRWNAAVVRLSDDY